MLVDPDPICKYIGTENANYLYECPCGISNEVEKDQYPFDVLHCWSCGEYSSRVSDMLDDFIEALTGEKSFLIAAGQPRKYVRDAIKNAARRGIRVKIP